MRLDSWKAIAEYLKRDVATVRRWEKSGLPVHRVPGGRGSSVFAYASEIDQWLADGGPRRPPKHDGGEATVVTAPRLAVVPQSKWRGWRWAGVAAAVVIGLGWWARASYATIADLRVELTPAGVIASTRANVESWRYEFPRDRKVVLSEVGGQPRMVFGNPEQIFAATSYSLVGPVEVSEGGTLMRFDGHGQLTGHFRFDDSYTFNGERFGAPWALTTFAVNDGPGERRVAVAAHHYIWDPGIVTVLDAQFRRQGTFVHAGWIEALRWLGPSRLAVGGYSNAERGGMIALLDTDALDGQGPAEPGSRHFCDSCGRHRPLALTVMPRSEVNEASGSRFNRVVFDSMHDHILARTVEVPADNGEPADAIYEFDQSLTLMSAQFSERYWVLHRQLEGQGKLTHSRAQCPDRDGPRSVRVWTPAQGWRTQWILQNKKGAS